MNSYQFVTQSSAITTTTEQPFLISPNVAASNSSLVFHEVKPLPSSYQNYTNTSYLNNESGSVIVTNGNQPANGPGEPNAQLQSVHAPESRGNLDSLDLQNVRYLTTLFLLNLERATSSLRNA